MNKKGMTWTIVMTIIITFSIVGLIAGQVIYKRMAGKEGGFNTILNYLGENKESFDEVKTKIEDYEEKEKWDNIIEELIYYRENKQEEWETIEYLETKAYKAYNVVYGIYIYKMKNPDGGINQFSFCSDAIRYYEQKDFIFDDFSELSKDNIGLADIELVMSDIANFCYDLGKEV